MIRNLTACHHRSPKPGGDRQWHAGMRTVKSCSSWRRICTTSLCSAPSRSNYNCILLSPLLAGDKSMDDIMLNYARVVSARMASLHAGDPVSSIDRHRRIAFARGFRCVMTRLLLATWLQAVHHSGAGPSAAWRDRFPRCAGCGNHVDSGTQSSSCGGHQRRAASGLEAANGCGGMDVTVVHVMDSLMERQLDKSAAILLKRLEQKGLRFTERSDCRDRRRTDKSLRCASRMARKSRPIWVMTAGVRPNIELAQQAGLHCERAIVVDDMQTYDPRIYAVGECVSTAWRLRAGGADLGAGARLAASHLAGAGHRRMCSKPPPPN